MLKLEMKCFFLPLVQVLQAAKHGATPKMRAHTQATSEYLQAMKMPESAEDQARC